MTYELEIQLEELHLEARSVMTMAERRQIEAEIELVQAELAVIMAEQDGRIGTEPPS